MTRVRHRRHLRLSRFVAGCAPVVALALAGAAIVLEGRWLPAASAVGASLSLLLGVMVLRLDRKWRLEVTMARAAQAAGYASEHERYAAEHRSFTAHMIGLLDAASDRISIQLRRIAVLEAEVTGLRVARLVASSPTQGLATFVDGPEWNELWPDLADAPTVVDLLKWDERMQQGLLSEVGDDNSGNDPGDRHDRDHRDERHDRDERTA